MEGRFKSRPVRDGRQAGSPQAASSGRNGSDKMERLIQYLEGLRREGFTGYVKITFSQGGVGRIERFEEVLKQG